MAADDIDFEDDMDYLDMEDDAEPEPEELNVHSFGSRGSRRDIVDDIDESKELEDMDVARNRGQTVGGSRGKQRSSYPMNEQTQYLLKQYQSTINELQNEVKSANDLNEKLMVKNETLIIEYDSKMDELNMEYDAMQIESQQYQIRYSEINEELHELRSSHNDQQSAGKENKELLLRLQNKEQNEVTLIIDLEQANKTNFTLKNQLKTSNANLSKLQKAMLQIKKDKVTIDKNLTNAMDKFDILRQQVLKRKCAL